MSAKDPIPHSRFHLPLRYAPYMDKDDICCSCYNESLFKGIISKICKFCFNNVNDDFNLLKNAALLGDKIKTNKLLSDTIIEADKNIYYLNLINQRLNKLSEILKLSKNSTIETAISNIKPPIFWKDKLSFIEQAKIWNHDKLKTILKETYKLEIEMKSNSMIEKNVLLKKLIIDMCSLANV